MKVERLAVVAVVPLVVVIAWRIGTSLPRPPAPEVAQAAPSTTTPTPRLHM